MKKLGTWSLLLTSALLFAVLGVFIFSPYRYNDLHGYKLIRVSTTINAPAEKVFRYLGNSANAANWSTYVDHITPLNNAEVPDGEVGSLRRCFVRADEKENKWDEEVLVVDPPMRRRLSIFNIQEFSWQASHLATEQLYTKKKNDMTELTFTLFFLQEPDFLDNVKMYFSSFRIASIFRANLQNIKSIVESQA